MTQLCPKPVVGQDYSQRGLIIIDNQSYQKQATQYFAIYLHTVMMSQSHLKPPKAPLNPYSPLFPGGTFAIASSANTGLPATSEKIGCS